MILEENEFMDLAFLQAEIALGRGQFPVGAVIVCNSEVLAVGHNLVDFMGSDLMHAEMVCMRKSEHILFRNKRKSTIYCTLEPCLMCLGAICHFRFQRVVYALSDKMAGGLKHLEGSPYYHDRIPEILGPVQAQRSFMLFERYCKQTGLRNHLLEYLSP